MISIRGRLKNSEVISVGLSSEWRFETGDRKSCSDSSESEYKNKSS